MSGFAQVGAVERRRAIPSHSPGALPYASEEIGVQVMRSTLRRAPLGNEPFVYPGDGQHRDTAPRPGYPAAIEGTLILIAALSIGVAAVDRLITPKHLEKPARPRVSVAASLLNLGRRAWSELNFRIFFSQTLSSR